MLIKFLSVLPPFWAVVFAAPSLPPAPKAKPAYWFSFGDSYTQTGFNITTGPLPTIDNPLGNPVYPGATATPGPNWIDVATVEFNHSLILTYNFGFSGATVSRDLVPPFADFVQTLPDQIAELAVWNAAQATQPWTSEDSLFSIWIGINDIDLSWGTDVDHTALTNALIARYFTHVQTLYDMGARNFLFLNVPPLNRTPEMLALTQANRTFEAGIIGDYNAKLFAGANHFKATHAGVRTWEYDANAAFNRVLDNPEKFGFNDTTGDDMVTPGQFWYNWLHPVSAAQVIFGKEVGELLTGTPW